MNHWAGSRRKEKSICDKNLLHTLTRFCKPCIREAFRQDSTDSGFIWQEAVEWRKSGAEYGRSELSDNK